MRRLSVVLALVCATSTSAWANGTSTDGIGRISVGGGLRWTMNNWFNSRAAEKGYAPNSDGFSTAPLGFQGTASFGYGAFDWFELAVDLFVGFESFGLQGHDPFTSTSYGALIGVRATRYDFPLPGLVPYIGFQTGPMLSTVTSSSAPGNESVLQAWSANAGAAYRFTDRFGIFLDVRYLHGRVFVADIAGRNVGGVFVSAGVAFFFPASPKRDLDVPGFGSSRP